MKVTGGAASEPAVEKAAEIEALVLTLLPIGRTLAHNHGTDVMLSALINLAIGLARERSEDADVAATLETLAAMVRRGQGPRFEQASGQPAATVAPGVIGHG